MTEAVKPCPWMRRALARMAEGRSLGLLKWYAESHLKKCPQCTATYRALLSIRSKLKSNNGLDATKLMLSEERWKQIENACEQADND